MKKAPTRPSKFFHFFFLFYVLIMLLLLFGRSSSRIAGLTYWENLRMNTNLTPFFTIGNYLHVIRHRTDEYLIRHCIINLAGNVLLFIPAGFLLPMLFKKQRNFFLFFFTCASAMLCVELIQLLTLLGSFDVDDLILNLSGMTLGYFVYLLSHRLQQRT